MSKREDFGYCDLSDSSSMSNDSDDSVFSSSSSSSLIEDDASSSSSSSFNSSSSPLYDFSVLMAKLPIKRGLSQFFHGKSQSFTSISEAICIQDLAKKERPYSKRMKYSSRNEEVYVNQKPNSCSRIPYHRRL